MNRLAAHERRVSRRLEARGEPGLGEALTRLDGCVAGGRYRLERLHAVGSEGAVYLARDLDDAFAPLRVAKVPLHPLHRPFDLTEDSLYARRESIREEAANLECADSTYMPRCLGLHEFQNPVLERDWGGEYEAPEPCLVMERLPGFDLDLWLARVHSSRVPRALLRRQLDHVAIVVLSALMELQDRRYFYTDLRPGNVRIRGRSKERVRLMDAGSLVRKDDRSGKFPHVPAYLPPELFEASRNGEPLVPTPAIQAVMAGRTLFEVATGRVPLPGEPVETSMLYGLTVSPSIAETIERLCRGSLADVTEALDHISRNFSHDASERPRRTAQRRPEAAPAAPPPARPERTQTTRSSIDLHSALAQARTNAAPQRGAPEPSRPSRPPLLPVPEFPAEAPAAAEPAQPERTTAADRIAEHIARQETQALEPGMVETVLAAAAAARQSEAAAQAGQGDAARAESPSPQRPKQSPPATAVPLAQAFAVAPKPSLRSAASRTGSVRTPTQRNLDSLSHPRDAAPPAPSGTRADAPGDEVLPPSRRSAPAVRAAEDDVPTLSDQLDAEDAAGRGRSLPGDPRDDVLPPPRSRNLFRRIVDALRELVR